MSAADEVNETLWLGTCSEECKKVSEATDGVLLVSMMWEEESLPLGDEEKMVSV